MIFARATEPRGHLEYLWLLAASFCLVTTPVWAECDPSSEAFYLKADATALAQCLKDGQDFSKPSLMGKTPLAAALMISDDINFTQMLWDAAAKEGGMNELDAEGLTYLHLAAVNKDKSMVEHFARLAIAAGVDPALPYRTFMEDDISKKHLSVPAVIATGRAPVDEVFALDLMHAYVSSQHFDPNAPETQVIMQSIAYYGSPAWARPLEALLAAGTPVDLRSDSDFTPLMYFANRYAWDEGPDENMILRVLLRAGADPNAINKDGETALHRIAPSANIEGVKLLLDAGGDPLALTPKGDSLLHWAARNNGDAKMVSYLLSLGIDPDLKNGAGQTALDILLAMKEGDFFRDEDVIDLLKAASRAQ